MPDPDIPPADDEAAGGFVQPEGEIDAVEEEEDREEARSGLLHALGLPGGQDFAGSVARAVNHAQAAPAAAAPGWAAIGPRNVTGAIRALVQDPRNALVLYAGSASGGAWKTVDGGLSWRPIGGPQHLLPVGSLALAPSDSRILYIGTGEPFGAAAASAALGGQGLFISTDGGEHLVQLVGAATGGGGAGSADHYTRIAVDPDGTVANGTGQVTTVGTAVTGTGGTTFTTFFKGGDLLKINDDLRVVAAVPSNTALTVDRPFPADVAAATAYSRATLRFWAPAETGLWRFEPNRGFVPEGPVGPVAVGSACSDVVVVQDPGNPGQAILYVGMDSQGLFRGVFTRANGAMAWTACTLPRQGGGNIAAGQIGRIRIALSRTALIQVYAVMENRGAAPGAANHPTHVYQSATFGTAFVRRARPYTPTAKGPTAVADYALAIAVHPTTPATVIVGTQDLYLSTNSGVVFNRVMELRRYEHGDRGQHADQHAIVFDANNPTRVWVANDGGISVSDRLTTTAPFRGWRKRSYGLIAAQFHDVSVHPTLPMVTGGGLRDLTTYLSYGGLTWYQVGFGDGGPMVFTNNPRVFFTSHQSGVDQTTVGAAGALPGAYATVVVTDLPDVSPPVQMRVQGVPRTGGIPAANRAPFVAVVEGHPTANNHLLVGRERRTFRTTNGIAFNGIGANLPAGESVSAIAFIPGQPSNQFWIGTDAGRVFRTGTAAAISSPWPAGAPPVHRLAIVSAGGTNLRVAVCSAGLQGEVFVADLANPGAAVNWVRLTPGLPPGPFTSVVFDPNNIAHLYVGTFAGVYGAQNLPAVPIGAGAAVAWQTFNAGLPLAVVHDLAVCPVTQTLRCATYGRGMFERSLATTPAPFQVPPALLLIRNHVMDDGRTYPAANTLGTDPRRGAAAAGVAIDDLHSIDIRVDAPRFRVFETIAFGEPIDGAELDESLVHDDPILGDTNIVYVQVQNRGHAPVQTVDVHLYFAAAPGPAAVPNLQPGFRAAFPGDPPAGAWQRVGPAITVGEIGAGAPAVVTFNWLPPLDLGNNAAVLALCTSAADTLTLATMPAANDAVATLVHAERRAAVRVMATVANPVFVRDAVDDDGTSGAVAWGGRSPDIVVLAAAPPADVNARPEFSDLDDPRLTDRVRGGNANHVIVRVHNRLAVQVTADVDLYRVQLATLTQPTTWTRLNAANAMRAVNIPPRGWRFTAAVQWNVPDADTTFILVALVGLTGTPPPVLKPDHTADVTDLDSLWRFLKTGPLADKAAMRALRRA